MTKYTRDDELNLSDIVAAARLAGMVPTTAPQLSDGAL